MRDSRSTSPGAVADLQADGHRLLCSGDWSIHGIAGLSARLAQTAWPGQGELLIDFSRVEKLDTAGVCALYHLMQVRQQQGQPVQLDGMRPEQEALLRLVQARVAPMQAPVQRKPASLLEHLGRKAWHWLEQSHGMLQFIGENTLVLLRALRRPAHLRFRLILSNLQQAGFDALPIIGLLSFLIGMVVAFQGSIQLARFGANIYIADLIGLSMLRELAPMMVAIIVAGRSGSAFAAQIGTMKVSEEIDALRSMSISPLEILVLPKLLAMLIALPLLTVFADFLGVLGGMVVASIHLDVAAYAFLDRFDDAVKLSTFLFGIGKAPVFAIIITLVGCYAGFQAQGSADSVGRQTTTSVVQAIFLIIIADALFSIASSLSGTALK